jgi:capsid protein
VDEKEGTGEVDGVRFDKYENPLEYHILNNHPGGNNFWGWAVEKIFGGEWVNERSVIHWFRQDRGWLRGIPETTPSLPLCALLRRYTLAVVRAAEVAADFAVLLMNEGAPNNNTYNDPDGNGVEDDPFDQFPIDAGMITTMPYGYKAAQMKAEQPTTVYDQFVNSMLREIIRPLLVPFNVAAGTSKDSNMASSVVDIHLYRGGIEQDRLTCNESVLKKAAKWWWFFALNDERYQRYILNGSLLPREVKERFSFRTPRTTYRWDRVGIDHTDPQKVAKALVTLREANIVTDRDIQESQHNRDVEEWREQVEDDLEFRRSLGIEVTSGGPSPTGEGPADEPDDSGDESDDSDE